MAKYLYDVFISHAYEDKNSFANELALALKQKGLRVWFSGFELKLGDSIAGSINEALLQARFGIVIISPIYLRKKWAMAELKALLSQGDEGRILPLLHRISVKRLQLHLPVLSDLYSISSSKGLPTVVNKILQVTNGKRKYERKAASAGKKEKASVKSTVMKPGNSSSVSESGFIALGGTVSINTKQFTGRDHYSTKKKKN